MSEEMKRTYTRWQDFPQKSRQTEYTEPTELLDDNGVVLAKGWARKNVFEYDRDKVRPRLRGKEWDFYQVSNGRFVAQVNFANISICGFVSAVLIDLQNGKVLANVMAPFVGGRNKYPLPAKGDIPNLIQYKIGGAEFKFDTKERSRTLNFKMKDVECHFEMELLDPHETITTVLPFQDMPTRFFMTMKQNCMPCTGTFRYGNESYTFDHEDSFCTLDWGRVNAPRHMVWYWGNGSTYLTDAEGKKHVFGFEITWAIGDEQHATETCLFYDGIAHKFGAVDVEVFPKPDKYMQPWHFVSEDGRFDMTMVPFYDHFSDMDLKLIRMVGHQVHGRWSGTVVLDDGTKLKIDDMYAFCEYVEDKW